MVWRREGADGLEEGRSEGGVPNLELGTCNRIWEYGVRVRTSSSAAVRGEGLASKSWLEYAGGCFSPWNQRLNGIAAIVWGLVVLRGND